AHDGHDAPIADAGGDLLQVVGCVDDEDLVLVADDPHVVVDVPGAAVEGERAGGDDVADRSVGGAHQNTTTERSTSPLCILWNASSTSSRPIVSVTNFSRGSRPCRYRSMSMGKSREGRQSPYQDDLVAPPRPKTSISGSSIVHCGFGTPTRTTVPARSRA